MEPRIFSSVAGSAAMIFSEDSPCTGVEVGRRNLGVEVVDFLEHVGDDQQPLVELCRHAGFSRMLDISSGSSISASVGSTARSAVLRRAMAAL